MADLTPASTWNDVYKLETADQVLGGGETDPANDPHLDLLCRTEYLKDLQKHSIRFDINNFTIVTTAGSPAKHLFSINATDTTSLTFEFMAKFMNAGTKRATFHLGVSMNVDSSGGIVSANIKMISNCCLNWDEDIHFIAIWDNVNHKLEVWIECEDSGEITCVLLPIYHETSAFGGVGLDNGLITYSFIADAINTSILSNSVTQMTLKFENLDTDSYLELSSFMGLATPTTHNNAGKSITNTTIPDYLPIGSVINWYGVEADIPNKWQKCDGTNGTPDMRAKFAYGANVDGDIGDAYGADNNTATFTTNVDGKHQHSGITESSNDTNLADGPGYGSPPHHTHNFTTDVDGNHAHSGTTNSFSIIPSSIVLYFIMKITA